MINSVQRAARGARRLLFSLLLAPRLASAQGVPPSAARYTPLDSATTARGAMRTPVTLRVQQVTLLRAIEELTMQARVSFVADRALVGLDRKVSVNVTATPLRDALRAVLQSTTLEALLGPGDQLVLRTRVDRAPGNRESGPVRLSGYVRNISSSEVVRRAQILVDSATGREANEEGFYVLLLAPGRHRVQVRAIGFAPFDTTLMLQQATSLDVLLRPRTVVLTAMKVQATKNERDDIDPKLPDMSVARLDLGIVRKAPPLLGEVDPLRSLTLLPGVSAASDASSAFNVRGGSVDQNLVMLDEATLYNPSHILGFLSTFNADAVDDVTLYKGAIPARFGGRLSSVVDVRQREGNAREFVGSASIGLLASRLIVEGPLPKERGSFMIAARRSYADAFLRLSSDSSVRDNVAYFYDVNAKANLRLGKSGALLFSSFIGRDRFAQPREQAGAGWGNTSSTLRWNQAFGRLFSKVTSTASSYDYRLDFRVEPRDSATWNATIASTSLKVDETFRLTDRQTLEFGGEAITHEFRPGSIKPLGDTTLIRPRTIQTRFGDALSAYLGHEVELGSRVGVRYGVRYGAFTRSGPYTRYRYANDAPVVYNATLARYEPGRVLDSIRISDQRQIVRYDGWEPRVSMRLSLTEQSSLKASYARTQQFVQLVSNTNSPTPLDIWEPVGEWIRPQRADQVALGYTAKGRGLEFTAEVYGKRARNVVDYIDGADIVLNPRIETLVVQGEGRAYGLELFLRKSVGRLSGWASYTLARAEQRFPVPSRAGAVSGGGVNGGAWYRSPYDKTHNLSLVGVYEWKPKWTVSSTFLFATGLPTTLPESRYVVDGFLVAEYGARNSSRLPAYHRLDVNFTRTLGRGELQFGVLNLYNRFNAQSLRVRQRTNDPLVTEAVQTSIFGIVPSINYVFKF